jgi:UDP-3-O-[3-hydroxymyristoyl] glucosamine N-acyltransferase
VKIFSKKIYFCILFFQRRGRKEERRKESTKIPTYQCTNLLKYQNTIKMQISAAQLAHILQGTVEGNPDVTVTHPAKIEEAKTGAIAFLGNLKYESYAYSTGASILLVSNDFQPSQPIGATLIRVTDVYASVAILLEKFGQAQQANNTEISAKAAIHTSVQIGEATAIGDFTVVEENVVIGSSSRIYPQVYVGKNVKIGNKVTLYPGVRIYQDCEIGDNCIIHANAIIGSDGFGFAPNADGTFKKVPQIGNVVIESNVEIGANTTIDRATMGSTIIREGVKLDNLIQIAHNVEIGKNTVIASQTGIAGSTKIGENCMIGGQVGIVGHLKIADKTRIQAQSGVAASITEPNTAWYGSPAIAYSNYLRSFAVFKQLPDVLRRLQGLEKNNL